MVGVQFSGVRGCLDQSQFKRMRRGSSTRIPRDRTFSLCSICIFMFFVKQPNPLLSCHYRIIQRIFCNNQKGDQGKLPTFLC